MSIHQLIAGITLSLCVGNLAAATIGDLKVTASSLGNDCKFIEGEYPVSIQAATLYPMITDTYSRLFKPPVQKYFQSIECSNKKGTIYYYQYANLAELESARNFIESLIWGGGGPSKKHPELIESVQNVLLIISSHDPQTLKKLVNNPK
jgi:hypothetical protein